MRLLVIWLLDNFHVTRTGPGVCVQGITDHQNVRGGKLELVHQSPF